MVSGFTLVNVGSKSFEEKHCWGGRAGKQIEEEEKEEKQHDEEEEEDAGRCTYEQGRSVGIN